jgi:hypothetical protein
MTGRRMIVDNKPYLVGIGIDITSRKQSDDIINEKLDEIKRINDLMTGRELQMIELKKKIAETTQSP